MRSGLTIKIVQFVGDSSGHLFGVYIHQKHQPGVSYGRFTTYPTSEILWDVRQRAIEVYQAAVGSLIWELLLLKRLIWIVQ